MSWNRALKACCDLYAESKLATKWIVVGSVGSVLQHASMSPNDLDIYVRDIEDVEQITGLLDRYNLKEKSERSYFDSDWHSSDEEPYFTQSFSSGFTWTKAKWKIQDFDVEVVQISNSAGIPDSDEGEGIWEGGRYIWDLIKHVEFENHLVPVVPLEIQLESNIRRKRQDRVDAILNALVLYGYNKELLAKALSGPSKVSSEAVAALLDENK
ncbi:hypothetical protein [Paenibacillus brevis]|uniref:Nucleotidyltransferase family protein n=1 Tax=Paenibacillus brevis TaxID=2841508 RepID=A0ABS6FPL9_9BACL|nr:hypothetical protein [Paenibacillus brevis]MBU5672096.1 hypothetical protein [Paenibacillus brevis]